MSLQRTEMRRPCACGCGQLAIRGRNYVFGHRGTPTLRERLLSRLVFDPETGCLLWTGSTHKGYGRISVGEHRVRDVHSVMWEMFEGPVPDGLELDHVKDRGCTNKHCASIAHLEPVTHRVNLLRGGGVGSENAGKTHCIRDHEFTLENTYIQTHKSGRVSRHCKICKRDKDAARRPRAVAS